MQIRFSSKHASWHLLVILRHCNSPDKDVRAPLVAGLQEMVESDQRLEGSKEAVIAIGRLAQGMAGRKAKAGNKAEDASDNSQSHRGLHFELLQVLLRLPIGRADAAELAGPGGDMSNADDDVKKGLAEASITLSAEQLRKREGELLYEVFVVYLRILRQRHLHSRELMGTVLTGLARWGQQVNLELLLEILSELRLAVKDAIARGDELVALHGLNCALVLLSGPSQALLTDVSWLSDSMTSLARATSLGTSRSLSAPRGATRRTASIGAQRAQRARRDWDAAPVEPNEDDRCFAYYLANSLDIQALTDNWKVIRFHSDVALLKVDEKDCFVFSFGCLVCWGCTPQEVNSARESVRNFLKEPLAPAQVETDNLDIAGGDALPVCHKVQERIGIAYSLAQSVRLSYWEQRIDQWIAATRTIPEDMARTGRVLLSSERVAMMMGELFALKNKVNLEFDTLDTPDVFWEFEDAEPIYVYARQHLDVDRRIHIVNQRFEVLEDMFDVLQDKLDERQGTRLTWIIIWLCALETIFSALKIIWTAGLLPAVQNAVPA
ncbi:RMD1 [Symbiodinium pilosum]|uniref:RMD1 protein n=1 Tax=Symbiodinium pilosum TaxID=2952 RepID=A0A812L6I3_SYMPI|nr:RMD1 [Symbiodinium pilosum]